MTEERYLRQSLLLSHGLKRATVILVGAGMLGSWMAHSLARTANKLIVYDFDLVGIENVGTQAYTEDDIGRYKVEALKLDGFPVLRDPEPFPLHSSKADLIPGYDTQAPVVLVSCVDNFETRGFLADWAKRNNVELFIDTRAHANVGVVYSVPHYSIDAYLEELDGIEEPPPAACGTEGTAYVGMWVASRATGNINRALSGLPVPFKIVHDVAMGEDLELALSAGDLYKEGGIPVR